MSRDWHEQFKKWAKPPSETEEEKASRAARMINDALRSSSYLRNHNFSVYASGSYRNNTNIRLGSDIDIAIVLDEAFFYRIPDGYSAQYFGLGTPAVYGLNEFRDDVGRALRDKFGTSVTQASKTFDIAGNAGRLPADATPFLAYRKYTGHRKPDGTWEYFEGVKTVDRTTGQEIINWHQDHYDNGVAKNTATARRFKRVVRILKQLREAMLVNGTQVQRQAATPMASFLLECIPFNAPDTSFYKVEGSYYEDVKAVIYEMWNATRDDASAAKLVEVNRRKDLFGPHQRWNRAEVNTFLASAWAYVGFS